MSESNAIVNLPQAGSDAGNLTARGVRQQVQLIQQVMGEVMQQGVHYGTIPGCGPKPALLKAGAEKIAMTFRLSPTFTITKTDLGDGHREYEVKCSLTHAVTGTFLGEGVGSCSTMEKKYRYRTIGEGKDRKRIENQDIADTYNTVLKMAKKRAQVDAILTATAASDIFEQDLEDMDPSDISREQKPPVQQPQRTQEPPKSQDQAHAHGTTERKVGLISEAQAKRFYAIGKSAGLSDDDMKFHLQANYGISSSEDIRKSDYEAICAWAQSGGEDAGAHG